jgi:hypothetical protein
MDRLLSLAAASESGEFVCASSAGEIHVYLQEGRIAWATDSRHPLAFAAQLQDTAGIDAETFRRVVEECRRERLPLGETLIQWGLTTLDGVRKALSHQIGQALSLLSSVEDAQDLFLERRYGRYAPSLTFEVHEILGESVSGDESPALSSRVPSPLSVRPDFARQLRSSVEGLSWVEVFESDVVVDTDPKSQATRTPVDLVRTTLLDGADFAAIRSTRSSVVGFSLSRQRSVWCRISADSTFGAVVSSIWSVAGASERRLEPAPPRSDIQWAVGSENAPCTVAIRSFMGRAHELLGAVVLGGDGNEQPLAGCGRKAIELEHCLETARRRRGSLALAVLPVGDDTERKLDSIGFTLKTMVSGEPRLWCLGAELQSAAGDTLWLFLDRRSSQGLGWAYLASLTRALSGDPLAVTP